MCTGAVTCISTVFAETASGAAASARTAQTLRGGSKRRFRAIGGESSRDDAGYAVFLGVSGGIGIPTRVAVTLAGSLNSAAFPSVRELT